MVPMDRDEQGGENEWRKRREHRMDRGEDC